MHLYKRNEILKDAISKKTNVIDLIVEMKNLAGLAIDLGFSALLLQDLQLVEKVKELAGEMNTKQYEIEMKCMLAAKNPEEALGLTSVIRVASAVEDITNAIHELTNTIVRGIPPHPAIAEALRAAAETVNYIEVGKKSKISGKVIKQITRGEVTCLGLKRKDSWMYQPKDDEKVRSGDIMILSGKKKRLNEIMKEAMK